MLKKSNSNICPANEKVRKLPQQNITTFYFYWIKENVISVGSIKSNRLNYLLSWGTVVLSNLSGDRQNIIHPFSNYCSHFSSTNPKHSALQAPQIWGLAALLYQINWIMFLWVLYCIRKCHFMLWKTSMVTIFFYRKKYSQLIQKKRMLVAALIDI